MMRFLTLLAATSLLVCHCAGQDGVDERDQDELNEIYPEDKPGYRSLNSLLGNVPSLYSATKRDSSDRQREMDMAARAQEPFFPYGRRTDIPGRPTGFVFGKRGRYYIPFEKREMDEVNPYSVAKRDDELTGLEEYEVTKRAGMSGLGLAFGKRGLVGSNFAFGKRAGHGMSNFSFGKRSGLSSLTFGKRDVPDAVSRYEDGDGATMQEQDDAKRALGSSFSFGKRTGLSNFAFGKRAGER